MNRLYFYILILFFSFNIFSQELTIKINNQSFFLSGHFFEEDILLKNDTSLFLQSGLYNFYNDSIDFMIYNNGVKNYNLTISNKDIFFDGLNDLEFQFLNHFYSHYKSLVNNVSFSAMNPDEYEIFMYNVKNRLNNFLKKEESEFKLLGEDFRFILINYIDLIYYNSLCEYILNSTNSKEKFNYKLIPYFLDESFYFNSAEKDFNFFLFKKYIYNMTRLLSYKKSSNNIDQSIRVFFSSFFQFAKENLNEQALSFCLSQFIIDYAFYIDQSFFNEIFNLLTNISIEEKDYIRAQYNVKIQGKENIIENLFVANTYDFYLEDSSGEETSLDDFLGKVLYIDIWASWCGPCRKLFPFSSALKKKFKKKQLKKIEFIYVSIDNDYSKWKKSIDQLKIDGENFISPAEKNNSIGQYFQVSSIPRYIIIDKSGQVIQENAKRPNDETLFNDLLELIND